MSVYARGRTILYNPTTSVVSRSEPSWFIGAYPKSNLRD